MIAEKIETKKEVVEEVKEKEIISQDSKEETKQPEKKQYTKYTKDFEIWWQAYPRKVGKKAAFKAWKKAKKEGMPPLEVLLKKLEKQKQSEQWQKEEYIPYPPTYLNQGKWEV